LYFPFRNALNFSTLAPSCKETAGCSWPIIIVLVDDIFVDDIYICHGDSLDEDKVKKSKTIIIGHEHPAVSLQEGARVEKFKAFLKGKYKRKTLLVQPSFNPVFAGTDVMREKRLSPFLQKDISNFEAWLVGDEVRYFGKAGDI